jgi:thiol-disulfide isomerase/thioredoxin
VRLALVPFHVASSDVWDQTANCSTCRMVKATEFLEGQKIGTFSTLVVRFMARNLSAATCLLALCLGCGTPVPNSEGNANRKPANQTASLPPTPESVTPESVEEPVALELVDIAGFKKHVTDRRGKVVFVDYWATWCIPCVKKFPETVELYQKFYGSDLEVISVSFDPAEHEAKVLKFLTDSRASFKNILHKESDNASGFDEHKIDGGIPFFILYDRTGKLRYRFSLESEDIENCEPTDNIDVRIRELLAE